MVMQPSQAQLFDDWAEHYDRSTQAGSGIFEGYDLVLKQVVRDARVQSGMLVLDLGTGTGNLAQRFVKLGCKVWAVDFSAAMLARARDKLPQAHLIQMDLLGTWAAEIDGPFARIVSTYVWHHFDLATKIDLLRRLARGHLVHGGRIVIGDIAFPSVQARGEAGAHDWDETEHYWAADETIAACEQAGLRATHTQVSRCGGVFVFELGLATGTARDP
jgi:putative AdoMet-dependent methyltransferase